MTENMDITRQKEEEGQEVLNIQRNKIKQTLIE